MFHGQQNSTTNVFTLLLVGGGLAFSPATQTAGSVQALAATLVPAGLTPVAYFPPLATQQLQAVSVIFLEAPLGLAGHGVLLCPERRSSGKFQVLQ